MMESVFSLKEKKPTLVFLLWNYLQVLLIFY